MRSTQGIKSAQILPAGKGRSNAEIQTAGVNFEALARVKGLDALVDLRKVTSNDIYAVLQSFGVEAARRTIVDQIRAVFQVYGIAVDSRHLGLIADYMTHGGGYTPLNRTGIESCNSPLQKMSFETTMNFLHGAVLADEVDHLATPSASIVLGKPPRVGTGAFELLAKLDVDDDELEPGEKMTS